jgi:predicted alpha/beta-hydrolase family hydrolase
MTAAPEVRGSLGGSRGAVSAAWIVPPKARCWLVVAHGAGAGMDHPLLVGFCRSMAERGVATARFNFRYADAGRRSPDAEPSLRAAWEEAFEGAAALAGGSRVLAGGKSLGGRIASICAADGMPAAGLVFLGYPLHPPGKPERIRDEHLDRVSVPMLFLQGTRDPFAKPEVLARVLARLGARATLVPIEGGDHSFKVPGAKVDPREVGAGLAEHAAPFVLSVAEAT